MIDGELRLERLIAAPLEQVFALWTDAEQVVRWWCPAGCAIASSDFDVRRGGGWHMTLRRTDGTHRTVSGVYRTIEPPRRLIFSWAWLDDDGTRGHETEVSVTLEPTSGGTRLLLLQRNFDSTESRERHDQGWTASFDRLARMAD